MTESFLYMEDCQAGQVFSAGPVTVTAQEIIAYARQFDPQDFHTDAEKAKDTAFGELVASGWHTASLTMRLLVEAMPRMKGGMIGRRIETLDWPRPVRPDDRLSLETEILQVRATSHPARGLLRTKTTTRNQNGDPVLVMEALIFVPRRPAESA